MTRTVITNDEQAPERLGPYKFYQYLFAVPDSDVIKFMKMLTFMELEDIAAIEAAMGEEGYRPNTAQMRLAEEVTRFVHGQQGVEKALKATAGLKPGSKTELDAETLEAIADDVPNTTLPRADVRFSRPAACESSFPRGKVGGF